MCQNARSVEYAWLAGTHEQDEKYERWALLGRVLLRYEVAEVDRRRAPAVVAWVQVVGGNRSVDLDPRFAGEHHCRSESQGTWAVVSLDS